MFPQKPKHKVAAAELNKAESVLSRLIDRSNSLSAAADLARGQLADQDKIESDLLTKDLPLHEVQHAAQKITAERSRIDAWLAQLGQMQAKISADSAAAIVDVLAAERLVEAAAGEHYSAAVAESAEKLTRNMRAAFREFVSVFRASEYFRGLSVSPANARDSFYGADAEFAWESLGKRLLASIAADESFYSEMEIGKPVLGGPLVEAADSPIVTSVQRSAARELMSKNRLTAGNLGAALSANSSELGLNAWERKIRDPSIGLVEDKARAAAARNRWALAIGELEERIRRLNLEKKRPGVVDWEMEEIDENILRADQKLAEARREHGEAGERITELVARTAQVA